MSHDESLARTLEERRNERLEAHDSLEGSQPRVVSQHVCGNRFRGCGKPAKLVSQQVSKGHCISPYVMRLYLCRWHLGWLNRYRKAKGKPPVRYKQELPDAEVLANAELKNAGPRTPDVRES